MSGPEDLKLNRGETGPEHIPSREEILAKIGTRCERPEVLRERTDSKGIFLLEVCSAGEDPKEATIYVYQRKKSSADRENPNNDVGIMTTLGAYYYHDGECCSGDTIANYDSETNEWVEK